MNEKQFYRLELDDMATPSFTSFGKFYYGTMEQLSIFMKCLGGSGPPWRPFQRFDTGVP